jgi:hypothetical protein
MTGFLQHPLVLGIFLVLGLVLLVLVAAKTGLLRILDQRLNTPRPATPRHESGEITEEVIAVLTAAAAAMLDDAVRVRRVRMFTGESGNAWTSVGRLNIMASHSLARRKT